MECRACGKALTADDRFCNQCGTPVQTEATTSRCEGCGHTLDATTRFCGNCGRPVAQPAAAETSAPEDRIQAASYPPPEAQTPAEPPGQPEPATEPEPETAPTSPRPEPDPEPEPVPATFVQSAPAPSQPVADTMPIPAATRPVEIPRAPRRSRPPTAAVVGAVLAVVGGFLPWVSLLDVRVTARELSLAGLITGRFGTGLSVLALLLLTLAVLLPPVAARRGVVFALGALDVLLAGFVLIRCLTVTPRLAPGVGLFMTLAGGLVLTMWSNVARPVEPVVGTSTPIDYEPAPDEHLEYVRPLPRAVHDDEQSTSDEGWSIPKRDEEIRCADCGEKVTGEFCQRCGAKVG